MSYRKFWDIMHELITGEGGTTIKNFNKDTLKEFAEHQDAFWDGLIQFYKDSGETPDFTPYFAIRQRMFPADKQVQSVVEYINDNADLVNSFLDECLKLPPETPQIHWNESFNELINLYKKYFLDNADIAKGTEGTIDDIRYANAGNSFLREPWVRPWRNQNTQIGEDHKRSYSDVRGNDKIERVLQDEKFIQFTRQTFWKYMNLLMPEYERSVEVEDLNRNFWVIGQVLTLIYNFLFAPDNPISQIFDNMLDEICQLWENLLYLWAGFAVISQDLYERDIRVIVVPVSNDDKYSYVKYDNFNVFATPHEAKLWEKVKYLKDIYNENTLIIIPEERSGSYFKNYYSKVTYIGAFLYNRNQGYGVANLIDDNASDENLSNPEKQILRFYPFVNQMGNRKPVEVSLNTDGLRINTYHYQNNPWGVFESTLYYHFKSDFMDDDSGVDAATYYAAIEPTFEIGSVEFTNGVMSSFNLSFNCSDRVKKLYGESDIIYSNTYTLQSTAIVHGQETVNDTAIQVEDKKLIDKGLYRGELVTLSHKTIPTFNIDIVKNWTNLIAVKPVSDKVAEIIIQGKDKERMLDVFSQKVTFKCPAGTTDQSETKTIAVKSYSPSGVPIEYHITEKPMGFGWVNPDPPVEVIIDYDTADRTAHFTNEADEIQDDSDNLLTSNAYVLKIGNYLPTQAGGDFTMATVSSKYYTSMRGNVTKMRSGGWSNNECKYYRFRWDTYNPQYDGDAKDIIPSNLGNNICYTKSPTEKSSTYPTEEHMLYDGLLAVKNFLKNTPDAIKNPAYFITTVGLTPWNGWGRTGSDIFWDSAFVPNIYFYIPKIEILTGDMDIRNKPNIDISQYEEAYKIDAIDPVTTDDTEGELPQTLDGIVTAIIDGVEVEVGKIVAARKIIRYEGYFLNYGRTANDVDNYYPSGGNHWRQFFVQNDDELNYCFRTDYNGGAEVPNGRSVYCASFTPDFSGRVKYFDVEKFNILGTGRANFIADEPRAQTSEAKILIDENGYSQVEEGKIVNMNGNNANYIDKPSMAADNNDTGLPMSYGLNPDTQQIEPDDIYGLIEESTTTTQFNANKFHGSSNLGGAYCIYK